MCCSERMSRNAAAPIAIRARRPHVNRSAREYKTLPEYHKRVEKKPFMASHTLPNVDGAERVLTAPAVAFVDDLVRRFRPRIDELLARRRAVQTRIDAGTRPDFLPETAAVRSGDWKVGAIPADLQDRRVEITGPVDRKMIINALNSGANVFMADFEDATSPTWANLVGDQANLMDAVRRTITYESEAGKPYALAPPLATLMVRPRGFHLIEKH